MPVLVELPAFVRYRVIRSQRYVVPCLLAPELFLLGYVGLAISLWPNVIPPSISIWQAASPPESQAFLLVGMIIVVPTTLAYTAYAYWVFRGKVTTGYH